MEDTIYSLFLTSEQGWSLYGTLRLRLRFPDAAATGSNALPPMVREALQPSLQELTPIPLEGELSVPLLSPFRQVPLTGVAYGTAAGLLSLAADSGAARPRAGIQLFPFSEDAGVLIWGATAYSELVFSVLARQLPRPA